MMRLRETHRFWPNISRMLLYYMQRCRRDAPVFKKYFFFNRKHNSQVTAEVRDRMLPSYTATDICIIACEGIVWREYTNRASPNPQRCQKSVI